MLDLPPSAKRRTAGLKELPPWERTGWRPPAEMPDLRNACLLSFDTETYDPGLLDNGPGWGRGTGHLVGLSIAALASNGETWCGYFPLRHEVERELNCNLTNVMAWTKAMLETPIPKTGANLIYDIGWLATEGVHPQGPLYDVQYAEALLDEQGTTALDYLGIKYLGESKSSQAMYEWQSRAYGGAANSGQRANIYRTPPSLVGAYGEGDALLPLRILPQQWALLAQEDLLELYTMECKLTRLLVRMRQSGVRVDLDYFEQQHRQLNHDIETLWAQFRRDYGPCTSPKSPATLGPLFEAQGIKVPKAPAGGYSIQKEWLEALADEAPIAADLLRVREYRTLNDTFVRGYVLEGNVNGRLHCSFNPLRTSKGGGQAGSQGAKTGRFSSSNPNLQNIPSRSAVGKRLRIGFVPDLGHIGWRKYDYSQIEYRMLAHFACDTGDGSADRMRDSYNNDPNTDYHDLVYNAACPYMGWDPADKELRKFNRGKIKNTNFGLLYGQGTGKLARTMKFTPEQARNFFNAYHEAAPYVKPTMEMCAKEVHQFGYVRTILNRRTRFDLWQPFEWDRRDDAPLPLPFSRAISMWGSNIKRAYEYRAVNYKFQGSAADMMKRAMVLMDESGVFNVLGDPKLTVHDELDFSQPDDSKQVIEAYAHMQHIMETAIPLRVPVRADPDIGPNWGQVKAIE